MALPTGKCLRAWMCQLNAIGSSNALIIWTYIGPGWYFDGRPLGNSRWKNQSKAPLQEHVSKADGQQTLSRRTGPGKAWTVFQTACKAACKAVLQSTGHLNGARPCGAMEMAKILQGRYGCKSKMIWVRRSQVPN